MSNPTPLLPGDVWPPRGPRTDHPLRAVVTRSGVPPYAWDWSVDVVDPATGRRDVELDSVDYGSVSTHTEALAAVTAVLERIGITERLESIRASIREESVSYGELAELQGLAPHIPAGDVELLEWAGVPEHDALDDARELAAERGADYNDDGHL